jgi:hypothetical protein
MENREQKNSVFSQGMQQNLPPGHAISQQEKLRQDFGLEIPVESVPLPSLGMVYPENSPLHGRDSVEIRAMTTKEEDILTSRALLKKGTVITELIKSCMVDKTVNVYDMLSGDRNALMVAIRITGYGPEYNAEIECPSCNVKSEQSFNLAELPIKQLEVEPVTTGKNIFEFTLPYTKKVVRFRFLTGRDEEEIMVTQEKQKKIMSNDTLVTTNLLYSIVSVDGIEDRTKIASFVRNMPARDSLALRNFIKDSEPGIEMKSQMECPSCGHVDDVAMPLGVTFLWPNARK